MKSKRFLVSFIIEPLCLKSDGCFTTYLLPTIEFTKVDKFYKKLSFIWLCKKYSIEIN